MKVVLDGKENTGKQHQASQAAMNLLANAGIPVRTVSQFKIMHDKVIIAGVSLEIGNFCTLSALFNQSWFVRG